MLIDIFARRYEGVQLRDGFEERDRRLLVQAFRILSEDTYSYYSNGKESSTGVAFWTNLHAQLSRELGLKELSPVYYSFVRKWNGQDVNQSGKWALVTVCENWMNAPIAGSADTHIKERLSLIELGFRQRENEIRIMNAQPIVTRQSKPATMLGAGVQQLPLPRDNSDLISKIRAEATAAFRASVEELNTRFRQAQYELHYHNGFIQASTDEIIQENVETPFWSLVADPSWANVDTDMKEALDLRDSGGRDPAFYAARALESAIKIISDLKGWTTGKENGASNYIDNLAAKAHGFIDQWEGHMLRDFFKHVRNPFGHGPGSAKMPRLTRSQTEWAIEFSMSWIKSLIRRF
jgi:hypothetical protein